MVPAPLDTAAALRDELQRFEQVLAEVAAGFVNIPAGEVDAAITSALVRIADSIQAERITLVREREGGVPYVSHSAAVAGIAPVAVGLEPQYPWALNEIRQGRSMSFSHIDELPTEAVVDRASWTRIAVTSNATVPFFVGGVFKGALAFACFRYHRQWPPDIIARMRLFATVLGNALEHDRVQRGLATAMAFERLISTTLTALLRAAPPDVDRLIETGLGEMAELLDADGVALWRTGPVRGEFHCMHRYQREGIFPAPDKVDASIFPWMIGELLSDRAVSRPVSAFPPAGAIDGATLRAMGGLSIVAVPFSIGGRVTGALSFASEREEKGWPESLLPRVQLFGEMIASVVARNQAEVAERDARAEATHAARLGTMGVVAASLAHELTQPLAAIMTNVQMAQMLAGDENADPAELRATLDDILADDMRAGKLIQQLRRFLRRDELERAALAMRPLIDEVLSLVRGEVVGKGIVLRLESPAALGTVVGNHSQIQQVLLNLLLNAFDAVAGNSAGLRQVVVTAAVDASHVSIEVSDNGVGMDEAAQGRAFVPFYTTKAKGMGLGLVISRSIAEEHGGSLTLRSTPGVGTVFRLLLPVVHES